MTISKLKKEVHFLKIYARVTTLLLGVLVAFVLRLAKQKTRFEEIEVERLNIIEKDGQLKMVISNKERQHPGIIDGKTIPRSEGRSPGIIFFNAKGDECGGLIFDSTQTGDQSENFGLLTFDKFRQDQTIGLQHTEKNGQYFAGLVVWDRPDTLLSEVLDEFDALEIMIEGPEKQAAMKKLKERGEFGITRTVVGKDKDKTALIMLADPKGQPRLKISVDVQGNPRLDFLDETGQVTYSLPPESP